MEDVDVPLNEMLTDDDVDSDANSLSDSSGVLDVLIDDDNMLESLGNMDEDTETLELTDADDVLEGEGETLREFVEEIDALVERIPDSEQLLIGVEVSKADGETSAVLLGELVSANDGEPELLWLNDAVLEVDGEPEILGVKDGVEDIDTDPELLGVKELLTDAEPDCVIEALLLTHALIDAEFEFKPDKEYIDVGLGATDADTENDGEPVLEIVSLKLRELQGLKEPEIVDKPDFV